jgi:3-deoxy-D-manno-octulosonic-acid transferase
MMYGLYNAAVSAAVPFVAAWAAAVPRHRSLLRRFSPPLPDLPGRPLWIHACSVGEINTARPLVRAMRSRWGNLPLLLTVSTTTGYSLAARTFADVPLAWFPFDHPLIVRRFLKRLDPVGLVLLETEVWPNVVRQAYRRHVPVAIVNGRISDKHFRRYHCLRPFVKEMFGMITAAGVQNELYAERMLDLGAVARAVHLTGNLKFDGVPMEVNPESASRVFKESGIGGNDPILVFGSTRPGDEALAATCWRHLRDEFPRAALVVAPRHVSRSGEVARLFAEPVVRRTQVRDCPPSGEARVLIVDTVGELSFLYVAATVAVVGGSFYPGVDGHNPLEPAALGVPVVFGPFMRNFYDPARILVQSGGAVQVAGPAELLPVLRGLLADEGARQVMGQQAKEAVRSQQGAIDRTLDMLGEMLGFGRTIR